MDTEGGRGRHAIDGLLLLSRSSVWPPQPTHIDPLGWLTNFDHDDEDVALALLESFIFFNEEMTASLLKAALESIAAESDYSSGDSEAWDDFIGGVLFTYPTGEEPHPTDSGHIFVRQFRTDLGFPSERIFDPGALVRYLNSSAQPAHIILVDDMIGTGDQLIATWTREYPLWRAQEYKSLAELWSEDKIKSVHAVCALSTWHASERLPVSHPAVKVRAGHIVGQEYSATASDSVLVPAHLQAKLGPFIEKYSGILGLRQSESYGHGDLGLNIAFAHSTPDLTLPLIWSTTGNWKPLRGRQ